MIHKMELQTLLTHHRTLVTPEDRGLPARTETRGRRSAGLSQEQADRLLSVSAHTEYPILSLLGVRGGWAVGLYQRLERGVLKHPQHEFLDDIALLLGMDEHARRLLWRYAADIAPVQRFQGADSAMPDMQAVLDRMDQIAYTTDYSFRRLQWNQRALEMFPVGTVVDGQPPANLLEWTIFKGRDGFNLQWEAAWRPLALAMLRSRVSEHPGDPELGRLEARVLADPTLGPWYLDPTLDALVPDGRPQPMCHGRLGPGWARLIFGQVRGSDSDFMIIDFAPDPGAAVDPFSDSWTS